MPDTRNAVGVQPRAGRKVCYSPLNSNVFAKPFFTEGVNYQVTQTHLGGSVTELRPFSYDHELTPRIWLGFVVGDGLGVRTRYWQYDHGGAPVGVAVPAGVLDREVGAAVASVWGVSNVFTRADGLGL